MTPRGCKYCNRLMWELEEIAQGHHGECTEDGAPTDQDSSGLFQMQSPSFGDFIKAQLKSGPNHYLGRGA